MSPRLVIGADPGLSGGLAVLCGMEVLELAPMPSTPEAILGWALRFGPDDAVVALERVGGWTGGNFKEDGGEHKSGGAPGSAMFKFGESYGWLRMAFIAAGFREDASLLLVQPQVWQRASGIEPRRKEGRRHIETKSQFKARLKQLAKDTFPQAVGLTLKTCDALLIALWCQKRFGTNNPDQELSE